MMFNCCTGGVLPDMSAFANLEISAVYAYDAPVGDGTFCESLPGVASGQETLENALTDGEDPAKVFYTVYGRDQQGFAEALHDADTLEDAKKIADLIISKQKHLSETAVI
ncbi:hypothetical protein [Alteromonas gilva]|uniref:Uncharacterized protein n=1 Tax=Alteromonas gilva TaxID=2987522 RepID=A0ABT5L8T5_9ALTE|nr:hypothetical protein [Alteromonas gilva]MDC8832926.1 hypothetical protein [Alteromonas gilva]